MYCSNGKCYMNGKNESQKVNGKWLYGMKMDIKIENGQMDMKIENRHENLNWILTSS